MEDENWAAETLSRKRMVKMWLTFVGSMFDSLRQPTMTGQMSDLWKNWDVEKPYGTGLVRRGASLSSKYLRIPG